MKIKSKQIFLILGILLLLLPSSLAASIEVSSKSGKIGETVVLDINIDPQGVAEKSGNVVLSYDPTKLTYVGVSSNNYFDQKIPPSESDGKITITEYTIGTAKSDAGLWAKVSFELKAAGTVTFDQTKSMWGLIPFSSFTDGTITISTGPTCGDNNCESPETCSSCPADCGTCPYQCGDGTCNPGETCSSCPSDCGSCCGNGQIDSGEECDGSNLGGKTCQTQGFDSGTLTCDNCKLYTAGCKTQKSLGQQIDDAVTAEAAAQKTTKPSLSPTLLSRIVNILKSWFS